MFIFACSMVVRRGRHLGEEALQASHSLLLVLGQHAQGALQLEALVHPPHKVPKHDAGGIHLWKSLFGTACRHRGRSALSFGGFRHP